MVTENLHAGDGTPRPLDELAALVQSEVDAFALTIGNLMDQAMRRNKAKFSRWVQESTPFSMAEANRLRTIFIAYRDLPQEAITSLPRPSSALTYTFESLDTTPWLSPTQGFSRGDLLAGALLGSHPEHVSADVLRLLREWIGVDPEPAPPPHSGAPGPEPDGGAPDASH